jgi:hypothetical protein
MVPRGRLELGTCFVSTPLRCAQNRTHSAIGIDWLIRGVLGGECRNGAQGETRTPTSFRILAAEELRGCFFALARKTTPTARLFSASGAS